MKPFLLILSLLSTSLFASESLVNGDIDCDGKNDIAKTVHTKNKVKVIVELGNGKNSNELIFGLGKSLYQDHLCGNKGSLNSETLEKDLSMMLGKNPEGYKPSSSCIGLRLSGGECDSFHIFWNHKTNQLNWWRL